MQRAITRLAAVAGAFLAVLACAPNLYGQSSEASSIAEEISAANDKRIVDCLLQGQIRKLGNTIYQLPPRPAKIPARDCEIRGGDFLVFDRGSFEASLGHWLGLAKEGNVDAQIYVGEIFERGMGRDPDYVRAAQWYQQAADDGHPVAQISLAQLYEKGLGVEKDPERAQSLYRAAFGTEAAYTVAIDPRSIDDPADRLLRLEQQLADTQDDADGLRQQLQAARDRLTTAETDLETRRSIEEELRRDLEANRSLIESTNDSDAEIEKSRQELARRNQDLEEQQFVIVQLQEEISRNRNQITAYEGELDRIAQLEKELEAQSRRYEQTNEELRDTRLALADSNRRLQEQQQTFEDEKRALDDVRRDLLDDSRTSDEQRTALSRQLADRESRLAEQSASLEQMRTEVNTYQEQTVQLQNLLTDLRRENEQLLEARADARRYQDEASRLRKVLRETEAQLVTVEEDAVKTERLAKVESELKRYQKEVGVYKKRLDELEQAQETLADLAGPEIQLIEPIAVNTRGGGDITIANQDKQSIIGKVSAPAGLLSLLVNQAPTDVNANNVFQSSIALTGENTPVRITAIDNQGKRSELIYVLINKALSNQGSTAPEIPSVDFGKFHALLIGNEEYEMLPNLVTPKEDIHAIDELLRTRYGFETTVLQDGTREEIMDSMYELLGSLTSEDNLLIYYAGHGEYVTDTNRGVWLPVDANPASPANWITNIEINDYLKQIRAKQIVVIADSCYSGALTRSAIINLRPGLTDEEYTAHLERMAKIRSRVVLTSGGLAPVLDGDPNSQHSIFASALIEILNQNKAILSAQDLGRTLAAKVSLAASRVGYDQEPQYAPLNHANHQGGDFFFVPEES
ncbi:MAG: caspase family protein [Pseudomonadota bacterium]